MQRSNVPLLRLASFAMALALIAATGRSVQASPMTQQFPVTMGLSIPDLDLGFGTFAFDAEVTSTAGGSDALTVLDGTSAEIRRMQLAGTASLFGNAIPISIRLGRDLGLTPTLGVVQGPDAGTYFDVFFEATMVVPADSSGTTTRTIVAYNQQTLRMFGNPVADPSHPFAPGSGYKFDPVDYPPTTENPYPAEVAVFDRNAANPEDPIGTIREIKIDLKAEQDVPSLPTETGDNGEFVFEDVVSGFWFDPPLTDGYVYEMTGDSKFTQILGFPEGFDDSFEVFADGTSLGTFGPGDVVNFGDGVSEFIISGINPLVDSEDPLAFPLQFSFDTPTASFTMTPTVPEPSSVVLVGIAVGACGLFAARRTQQKR